MAKRSVVSTISLILVLVFSALQARAQEQPAQERRQSRMPGLVYDSDFKGQKPGPAPKRDISGIWEAAKNSIDAVAAVGAKAMPSDGKPEHELPYTPEGLKAFLANKPTFGTTIVPAALSNDPMPGCDPQGFPRIVLHNMRTSEILQTPDHIVILYEFNKKWRMIWTDGRALPKDPKNPGWSIKDAPPPDSRWWGYAVGKWVDDYTFVAESNGFDDRTWLDNAGRPHSDALHVIETYHRTDADHLELTITIDDPKMYTKPWVALDKESFRLQHHYDIPEMECAPSETKKYDQLFSDPAADGNK